MRSAVAGVPMSSLARGLGVEHVRLRQLRLHHRRHHRGVQRLLRRRGRRQGAWATFAWTAALSVSYALILAHRPAGRRVGRRARGEEAAAALSHRGLRGFHRAAVFRRPGAVALALVLDRPVELFLRHRREPDRRVSCPSSPTRDAMGRVRAGAGASATSAASSRSASASPTSLARTGRPASESVPVTMLITAAFFAVAATPTFLFLRGARACRSAQHRASPLARACCRRCAQAQRYRDLRRFLLCILFYQAGITAVVALAAIYAEQAMKFTTQQTIVLILVVNITAAIGAFGFGYVQDAHRPRARRRAHAGGLDRDGRCSPVSPQTQPAFWVAANLAGLCMGSSQAAGRAHRRLPRAARAARRSSSACGASR